METTQFDFSSGISHLTLWPNCPESKTRVKSLDRRPTMLPPALPSKVTGASPGLDGSEHRRGPWGSPVHAFAPAPIHVFCKGAKGVSQSYLQKVRTNNEVHDTIWRSLGCAEVACSVLLEAPFAGHRTNRSVQSQEHSSNPIQGCQCRGLPRCHSGWFWRHCNSWMHTVHAASFQSIAQECILLFQGSHGREASALLRLCKSRAIPCRKETSLLLPASTTRLLSSSVVLSPLPGMTCEAPFCCAGRVRKENAEVSSAGSRLLCCMHVQHTHTVLLQVIHLHAVVYMAGA